VSNYLYQISAPFVNVVATGGCFIDQNGWAWEYPPKGTPPRGRFSDHLFYPRTFHGHGFHITSAFNLYDAAVHAGRYPSWLPSSAKLGVGQPD